MDSDDSQSHSSEPSSDESDELLDFEDWKTDFTAKLGAVKSFGTFAHMSTVKTFVNPGLTVDDNPIPLPLVSRDAEHIRSQCRQAPFGRGDQTVVDTQVRKTWELGGDRVKMSNPAWPEYMDGLLKLVSGKLGTAPLRAELYKLLLYDPGSFFKRHKDSEKSPGMIATLVICLPSEHGGGGVHLSHSSESLIFDTSKGSAHNLTALAWYSDVTHEVKEVTSGHRLVLTYNLFIRDTQAPSKSAQFMIDQAAELRATLKEWPKNFSHSASTLVYPLTHKYSQTSLSMKNLKGTDRARAQALADACRHADCYLFLGNVTFKYNEDEDYGDEDELDIDFVVTCEGHKLDICLSLEPDEILGPGYDNLKSRRDPDSQDEGEFTGNESAPAECRYHDSAAIIFPRQSLPGYLRNLASGDAMETELAVAGLLRNDLNTHGDDQAVLRNVQSSLEVFARSNRKSPLSKAMGDTLATMLRICRRYRDPSQLKSKALSLVGCVLKEVNASRELSTELGSHLNSVSDCTEDQWNTLVGPLFSTVPSTELTSSCHIVETLLRSEAQRESFRAWKPSLDRSLVLNKPNLVISDHSVVANVLRTAEHDWTKELLIPYLGQHADRDLLIILLHDLVVRPVEAAATNKLIIQQLLEVSLDKVCLRDTDFHVNDGYGRNSQSSISRDRYLTAFTAVLFSNKDGDGLMPEAEKLLRRSGLALTDLSLGRDVKPKQYTHPGLSYSGHMNQRSIPPQCDRVADFVVQLTGQLRSEQCQFPTTQTDAMRTLFVAILRRYILWQIPNRPTKPGAWAYKRLSPCGYSSGDCRLCQQLNSFLESPHQQEWKTSPGVSNIKHLQNRAYGQKHGCEETIDKSRTPYTLIFRKRQRDCPQSIRDLQGWKSLLMSFVQLMKKLQTDEIKLLLGDELYRGLIMLESIQAGGRHPLDAPHPWPIDQDATQSADNKQMQPLASTQANAMTSTALFSGAVAGQKRRAEDGLENAPRRQRIDVVDLVSD